jgi:hypothetical protein
MFSSSKVPCGSLTIISLLLIICPDPDIPSAHSELLGGNNAGSPVHWRRQRRLPGARQLQPAVCVPHTQHDDSHDDHYPYM